VEFDCHIKGTLIYDTVAPLACRLTMFNRVDDVTLLMAVTVDLPSANAIVED